MNKINKTLDILRKINFNYKINIPYFVIIGLMNSFLEVLGIGLIYPILKIFLTNDINSIFQSFHIDKLVIINHVSLDKNNLIKLVCFFLIIVFSVRFLIRIFFAYKSNKIFQVIRTSISSYLIAHYIKINLKDFISDGQSNKIRNVLSETQSFAKNYINLVDLITELILIISLFSLLFYLSSTLIVFILFLIFVIFFFHRILIKPKIEEITENRIILDGQTLKKTSEILNNFKEFKFFLGRDFVLKKIKKNFRNLDFQKFKLGFFTSLIRPVIELIFIIIVVGAFIFYSLDGVTNPEQTIAEFGVIFFAILRILPSTNRIIQLMQKSFMLSKSVDLLHHELNIDIQNRENISKKINFDKNILVEKISYEYNDKKIINFEKNLKINKNSINVITGRSGLGKTTLIDILSGLRKPKGNILIDDKQVQIFENYDWFSKIVYFSQNSFIFDDNLKENIVLSSEFDEKKFNDLVDIFQLKELLDRKTLGELSKNISGGQKQRVALARTLYSSKEIVILDEPTNMLDQINRTQFINYLNKNRIDKTYIIVTHDKELIDIADNLVNL